MAEVQNNQTQVPVAIFKKRGAKGQANLRKRLEAAVDSSSGSEYSSEDESGHRIKRRRKAGGLHAATVKSNSKQHGSADALKPTQFAADPDATITTNDATKSSNWYDEAASITKPGLSGLSTKSLLGSSSTYKLPSSDPSFIQRNPNAPEKSKVGPVRAAANVRTITVTDFAPDVCKDYKQTGFCGFGDNCKYLHAREDYKQGWELDKEWEKVGKDKKTGGTTIGRRGGATDVDADDEDAADDALLENIPFACILCKKPYTHPIVTKCGHYFCEKCALTRYKKSPSCAACGAGTGGVFNGAKQLKRLLERKRERAKKRKERAREAGEEVSSDEDAAETADA